MMNAKQKAIVFIATGGWIGFAPVAPGTFGSLAALPLCWVLSLMSNRLAWVALLALTCLSVGVAHQAERIVGRQDPKQVVIDEICGMAVTMVGVPLTPVSVIGGFALFRLFDIVKPLPIRWADKKVTGGLGIVLDDIIAGLFANILLNLGMRFFDSV